jgi:hypothetical protein
MKYTYKVAYEVKDGCILSGKYSDRTFQSISGAMFHMKQLAYANINKFVNLYIVQSNGQREYHPIENYQDHYMRNRLTEFLTEQDMEIC